MKNKQFIISNIKNKNYVYNGLSYSFAKQNPLLITKK